MKYGFVLPMGNARTAANLAQEAEKAGWDGFFVWEGVWSTDAWVSLTAAAMVTERIRLGTMLTPPSRMRPWKLASETATLDNLSNGRVILSVGIGAIDSGFEDFGEVTDKRIRAELLDESLEILTGLWRGQPFTYDGKHYHIKETKFPPPPSPVQQPRIPIWVVGVWPSQKSMQRVLKYDGLIPQIQDEQKKYRRNTPDDIRTIKAFIEANRPESELPFDFIQEGVTPGDNHERAVAIVQPWAEAGVTWWIEAMWDAQDKPDGLERVTERIQQGPPRL